MYMYIILITIYIYIYLFIYFLPYVVHNIIQTGCRSCEHDRCLKTGRQAVELDMTRLGLSSECRETMSWMTGFRV